MLGLGINIVKPSQRNGNLQLPTNDLVWLFDANLEVGLSEGNQVLTLADQSGNGNNATRIGNTLVTYREAVLNGNNVYRFAGLTGFRITGIDQTAYTQGTLFAVFKRSGSNTNVYNNFTVMVGSTAGAGEGSRFGLVYGDVGPNFNAIRRNTSGVVSITQPRNDNWNRHVTITDATDLKYRLNGSEVSVALSGSPYTDSGDMTIGVSNFPSNNYGLVGDLAICGFYSRALSPEEITQLELYLSNRYAI